MYTSLQHNRKKLTVLVLVLALCAACLVTVAYAYTATYSDDVDQKSLGIDEKEKYVWITDQLSYPEKINVDVDVRYGTVTTIENGSPTTVLSPVSYDITALSGSDTAGNSTDVSLTDDGYLLVNLGQITVHKSDNADVENVFIYVTDLQSAELTSNSGTLSSILTNGAISDSDIYFNTDSDKTASTHSVGFGSEKSIKVNVYLKAKITTHYGSGTTVFSNSSLSGGNITKSEDTVDSSTGNVKGLTTTLAVPGFTVTIDALDRGDIVVYDTLTVQDINVAKTFANADPATTLTVIQSSDGASIVLNAAAILELSDENATFSATADTTDANKFTISLGSNTFLTAGRGDDSVQLTISVPYPGSGALYAIYSNGTSDISSFDVSSDGSFATFKTNHLSVYRISSENIDAVAEAVNGSGLEASFAKLSYALESGNDLEVKMIKDTVETLIIERGQTVALDLNGKKISDEGLNDLGDSNAERNSYNTILVLYTGTLTLKDTSTGEKGTVDATVTTRRVIQNNGTLTVEDGINLVRSKAAGANAGANGNSNYAIANKGIMTIHNANISMNSDCFSSLIDNGYYVYSIGDNVKNHATVYVEGDMYAFPELTINGGTFKDGNCCIKNDFGGKLTIKGGTFDHDIAAVRNLNEATIDDGTFNGNVQTEYKSEIAANVNNCTTIVNGGTFNGYFTQKSATSEHNVTLVVSCAEALQNLAKTVNDGKNTFQYCTVNLGSDIDLSSISWTPIGTNADSSKFQGTFDGNGKTISNLSYDDYSTSSVTSIYTAAGLFGALNGIVKDLTVSNAIIKHVSGSGSGGTDNGIAVVAGSIYKSGTISNVTVKDSTVEGNRYMGGIAGYVYGTITNCTVSNLILKAVPDNLAGSYDNGDKVGGIAGYFPADSTNIISSCKAENVTITGYRDLGCIVGAANLVNSNVTGQTITNNTISGTNKVTVDQCTNSYGAKTTNAGDFVGRILDTTPLTIDQSNVLSEDATVDITYSVSTLSGLSDAFTNWDELNLDGVPISIDADLSLSDDTWSSIELSNVHVKNAIVLGNGHTISGLTSALFGHIYGTSLTVSDLTLSRSTVTSGESDITAGVGVLINNSEWSNVSLVNCTVTDSTINCSDSKTGYGGLIGVVYSGSDVLTVSVTGCTISNLNVTSDGSVGAVIGHCEPSAKDSFSITNCTINNCSLSSSKEGSYRVGLVVGTVSNTGTLVISGCTFEDNNRTQTSATNTAPDSIYYGRIVNAKVSVEGIVYSGA